MGLSASDVSLAYGRRVVVSHLSLSIREGAITALVGPNGSGKSTILRALGRVMRPKSGAVLLDGRDIASLPTRDVARKMGMLPQSPNAPGDLTVQELVSRGRYPHLGPFGRWTKVDDLAVDAALEATSVISHRLARVDELSGGERQRVWIAMLLAQQSDLALLDEPTTFLDLAHQMSVLDLLGKLRDGGKTILVVLHDLNQASRQADDIIVLCTGSVRAQGAPREVFTKALLREVFHIEGEVVQLSETDRPYVIPMRLAVADSTEPGEDRPVGSEP